MPSVTRGQKTPLPFRFPASIPVSRWGDRARRGRVGILGGSFNPAHEGHRHISLEALKRLALDEIWWLVSPQNPLKSADEIAPLALRLERAQSVAAHPRIRVAALEAAWGTRYTIETLRVLRQRFPLIRFVWLMGADNLEQIPRWKRWDRVMSMVPVAILDRGPYSERALTGKAARRFAAYRKSERNAFAVAEADPPAWVFLPIRRHGASATALRARGLGLNVPSSGFI